MDSQYFDAEVAQEQDLFSSDPTGDLDSGFGGAHDNGSDEDGPRLAALHSTAVDTNSEMDLGLLSDVRHRNAVAHFKRNMAQCVCTDKCSFPGALKLALSFAVIPEPQRINTARCILVALAAPAGTSNELAEWDTKRSQARKKQRRALEGTERITIKYALRGKRVCLPGFSAVLQLHPRTITTHAGLVASSSSFIPHLSHIGQCRKGKLSAQSVTAFAFLERHGELNAMSCPTGRGSSEDQPLRWLPSDCTKAKVHEEYKQNWYEIMAAVISDRGRGALIPTDEPLGKDAFCKVWKSYLPTLRILKVGSDFCDTCTQMKNYASTVVDPTTRNAVLDARLQHRQEAATEFKYYRDLQDSTAANPGGGLIHIVFDFAEKVLLPHLVRQPGQLHFVTGLKFDFFGVSSSNLNKTHIFGLPEGHWPGGKTANEVASMLGWAIAAHRDPSSPALGARTLKLHADNCSGQNKNKFILWFLAWRVIAELEDSITLYFLVAGHTKNRCDGAFGLVKRRLKQRNAICPADMMRVVEESAGSNTVVCSADVEWVNWKDILGRFFTTPSSFRITKYHVFNFERELPGVVKVKSLTSSTDWETVSLLKRGAVVENVRSKILEALAMPAAKASVIPLAEVFSKQERTREAYLEKQILERYYPDNRTARTMYFGDGRDWEREQGHGTAVIEPTGYRDGIIQRQN